MERTFGKGKEQEKEAISTSWTLCQTAWEVSDSHVRLLFIDLMPWHYCTQSWRFHVKWNRWRYTDTWSTLKHWPIKYCGRGLGTGEQWEWGVPWWGNKYCGEWSEGQCHIHQAGNNWKWPKNEDHIFYYKHDIIRKIEPPIVFGYHGQFGFVWI